MTETFLEMAKTHLWQISILFGIVFLIGQARWMKSRPHLMLVLWVMFLVKCLIPPVVQSPISPMAMLTPSAGITLTEEEGDQTALRQLQSETIAGTTNTQVSRLSALVPPSLGSSVAAWITIVWMIGSAVVLILFAANFYWVRDRILKAATNELDVSASETQANEILRRLEARLGFAKDQVSLVVSRDSLGPLVFGFLKPTVVLPENMLQRSIHLRPIIAHELCHIWRRDHLLGVLQVAAQVLFWFHPLVWIASRQVNRLCEVCCDDDAIRIFDLDSNAYANGLLDVLSMQQVVRSVALAPGIRPVEVTKQRLKKIVFNSQPKNRQSCTILVCVFLALVIPSLHSGTNDSDTSKQRSSSTTTSNIYPAMTIAEVAERRTEMDFLLGNWNVTSLNGKPGGESEFAYEKSGKMIREDWTAPNGATAQGITFYDPNEACWKMTWVDSSGTIMESSGQWNNESLTLKGWMTSRAGIRRKAQTTISKISAEELRCELSVHHNGRMETVSKSSYRRTE